MKEKEMECVYPRSPNENFPEIISADIQSCILNAICVGLMRSWNFNWCWCVTNLKKTVRTLYSCSLENVFVLKQQ